MRECITVLAMIVLLTPHLFKGGTAAGVSGISGEFSGRLVTKALESFGAGSSSIEGVLELSVPACSASTLGLLRGLSERR
jgi:hypothetical protein